MTAEATTPFDLSSYHPETSFVPPLIAAIQPDRIPQGQTAVEITEAALLALPSLAVAAAIESLRIHVANAQSDATEHEQDGVFATSPLKTVGDYLSALANLPDEELTPTQREIKSRLNTSAA